MLTMKDPWTGEELEARLRLDSYVNNKRIYIGVDAYDKDVEAILPYCDLTVNLPGEPLCDEENCGFVDTSNCEWLPEFIKENNLGEPTGLYGFSGWCMYPEYRFNMDSIREIAVHFNL